MEAVGLILTAQLLHIEEATFSLNWIAGHADILENKLTDREAAQMMASVDPSSKRPRLNPFLPYTQTYNMTSRNSQTASEWDVQQCNKIITPPSLFPGGLYCPDFIEILTPKHQESVAATGSYQVHPSCNECDMGPCIRPRPQRATPQCQKKVTLTLEDA